MTLSEPAADFVEYPAATSRPAAPAGAEGPLPGPRHETFPRDWQGWYQRGAALFRQNRFAESVESYRNALALAPGIPECFIDLGIALKRFGRPGEAEAILREGLRRAPKNRFALFSLADLLTQMRRFGEAETVFRTLIAAHPDSVEAHENFGGFLLEMNRIEEAIDLARAIAEKAPGDPRTKAMLTVAYERADRLGDALAVSSTSMATHPPETLEMRLASYMSLTGRTGRLDLRGHVLDLVKPAIARSLPPDRPDIRMQADRNALRRFAFLFPYYGIDDRSLLSVIAAAGALHAAQTRPLPPRGERRHGRLRVGYLSYNFGDHPIGHLLTGFFEAHQVTGAELYLYALHKSQRDDNGYRRRIEEAPGTLRDVAALAHGDIARLIRADDIDILIDLDGYLGGGRPDILAARPAPIQIHWLQHLAGMPAPFIDYTIVDRVIVPDQERNQGNGPLIRLPDAFQCGERLKLPDTPTSRSALGLPEHGFVFCAFGNWLKIDPSAFDAWMAIIGACPDSVLWLSEGPPAAARDLFEARARSAGIEPGRLIFAPRLVGKAAHLDRHRAADLFLDTFTVSAATTTTDALSAGLPVLTKRGATAQARLSESLIRAVGADHLIVPDTKAYIATAIDLARHPKRLARHRDALTHSLRTAHLFDQSRMARQFGQLYAEIWRRHGAGLPPGHVDIDA